MRHSSATNSPALALRAARISSGLLLLLFVTSHLSNLSLGMISIAAMDAARPYVTGVWTGPIMGKLLFAALLIHFLLGLWSLYLRPTLHTNTQDIVQLFTGLLVVPLLATHAIGTSMAINSGQDIGYAGMIRLFWLQQPSLGLLQVCMLSVVWAHGCAGLFTWLRSKESAKRLLFWLYPCAVLIPVLALLGYAGAGREILTAGQDAYTGYSGYAENNGYEGYSNASSAYAPAGTETAPLPVATIKQITESVIYGSILLTLLTLTARLVRLLKLKPQDVILVSTDGSEFNSTSALSVLEGFQRNEQMHANLCAGRGRCGTCAVRILNSDFPLPSPSELELRTLAGTGAPQGARLACQLRPIGGRVEVSTVYPADYTFEDAKPSEVTTAPEASA